MIKINSDNKLIQKFMSFINHYDHDKYWRRREVVVNPNIKASKLKRLYYLYYVKKVDSYWHCSFGTGYMTGSQFLAPPTLWHGPNGIIMGYNVTVGKNSIICQRVTMAQGAPTKIGDNVFIGTNAYIAAGITIGDNVKIGANCVVVEDIPANSTVVMQKPRIIQR